VQRPLTSRELQYGIQTQAIQDRIEYLVGDMAVGVRDLGDYITTQAEVNRETFPMVTIQGYEKVASRIRARTGVELVYFTPYITKENLEPWSEYSAEHSWWLGESWETDLILMNMTCEEREFTCPFDPSTVAAGVHSLTSRNWTEINPGPFEPFWMTSPPFSFVPAVNLDLHSVPDLRFGRSVASQLGKGVFGPVIDVATRGGYFISNSVHESYHQGLIADEERTGWNRPHFQHHQPVFSSSYSEEEQVGMLSSLISFDRYLVGLLDESVKPIRAVISNDCNQSYTYTISGTEVCIQLCHI